MRSFVAPHFLGYLGRGCSFIRLNLAIRWRLLLGLFWITARRELYSPGVKCLSSSPQSHVSALSVLTLKGARYWHLSLQLLILLSESFRLAKQSPHLSIIFSLASFHPFMPYKIILPAHSWRLTSRGCWHP